MASVIAFDVNETLLDLRALDAPLQELLGSAALRPHWFALMLQLSFTGGLTGRYADFTAAQRAALAMLAEREGVPLRTSDIDGLVGRVSSLPPHPEVPDALAALARTSPAEIRSLPGGSRISAARTARSAQSSRGPGMGAAQHGDLVPKHEQLGVVSTCWSFRVAEGTSS